MYVYVLTDIANCVGCTAYVCTTVHVQVTWAQGSLYGVLMLADRTAQ